MTLNRHQPQRLRSLRPGGAHVSPVSQTPTTRLRRSNRWTSRLRPVALTQAFTCPHNPEAAPLVERDDGNVLGEDALLDRPNSGTSLSSQPAMITG